MSVSPETRKPRCSCVAGNVSDTVGWPLAHGTAQANELTIKRFNDNQFSVALIEWLCLNIGKIQKLKYIPVNNRLVREIL